jgi:hypothetical protein
VGLLVVGGAEHRAVAVAAVGVVPGFDPLEDRRGELAAGVPAVLVEELQLQGAEEASATALSYAVNYA